MRLKEIKEGMVIICANREERRMLWEELCRIGNMKIESNCDSLNNFMLSNRAYLIKDLKNDVWNFADVWHQSMAINFSDLIIKDELTNEEVIELLREKYTKTYANIASRRCYTYQALDDKVMKLKPSEIIDELVEYKKSKEIKVVSKEEYAKVASDKLDELYPKGWKVKE